MGGEMINTGYVFCFQVTSSLLSKCLQEDAVDVAVFASQTLQRKAYCPTQPIPCPMPLVEFGYPLALLFFLCLHTLLLLSHIS